MGRNKAKAKGPRGKMARAKAKLDRRWGEVVDDREVEAARIRRGRSRLLSSGKNAKEKFVDEPEYAAAGASAAMEHDDARHYDESDVDYSSSDGDEAPQLSGDPLRSLLSRIGGSKKQASRSHARIRATSLDHDADDDDADMSSGTGGGSGDDESDEENITPEEEAIVSDDDIDFDEEQQQSNGQGNGDESDDEDGAFRGEDPFAAHFGRPPLPESEDGRAEALAKSKKMRKVPGGTPHIDAALELKLSGPILDKVGEKIKLGSASDENPMDITASSDDARLLWDEMSAGPYGHLREVLARNWSGTNAASVRRNADGVAADGDGRKAERKKMPMWKRLSALQATVYPSLSSYADLQITAETRENREDIHNLLALHVLNHVLTSRSRVQKHNRRRKELSERDEESDDDGRAKEVADEGDEDRWRDQGYTRPKVLVLLPTRGTALSFVRRMLALMGDSASVNHLERFEAEYSAPPQDDEEGEGGDGELKSSRRRKAVLEAKGSDWNELFGEETNGDDDFKMGMSLTPNVVRSSKKGNKKREAEKSAAGISVKLYSEFYRSDIILASPLALKMATSSDDGEKDGDRDFLSSVEICLVPYSDVLLQQNWDHVNSCLDCINLQPSKSNDTDFSRVRNYLLAGQSAHWRQLIFVSRISDPFILSSFKRHAGSVAGQLKLRRKVPADEAAICDVLVRVKQVFQRVPCQALSSQGDDRLKYFTDKVLPQMMRLGQKRTMIYIPSYFDFVSVRNVLLKKEASFVSVTEYARVSEVSRGRARFVQGRKNILLYTGRAHFFLRHRIKGARHLIFFGLPEHAEFYSELMNMLMEGPTGGEGNNGSLRIEAPPSCLALITKYDAHSLERIVGTGHCERMIKGEKSTFLFCS